MRDSSFLEPTRPEPTSLQIDATLFQIRPLHGIDRTLRSVLREWRAFSAAFLLVIMIGALVLILSPRQYSAEATVMAAARQPDLARTGSVLSAQGIAEPITSVNPDIEGEVEIMTSPQSLRNVVQTLHLDKPQPGEAPRSISLSDALQSVRALLGLDDGTQIGTASFRTTVAGLFGRVGINIAPKTDTPDDAERLTELAVQRLSRGLKVGPIGRSTMVRIEYSASNPQLAADVPNAVARNYIEMRFRARMESVAQASTWLERQTDELRSNVTRSEAQLEEFRAKVNVHGLDAAQLQNEMRAISDRMVAARADLQRAQSKLAVAEARVHADGPLALLSWDANPGADEYLIQMRAIAEMRREATKLSSVQGPFSASAARLEIEAHNLERQLSAEALTKLGNLQMNVEAASAEEASLEASFQSSRADYDRFQASSVQLSALERTAAASRAVYETFVTRWKTTQQAAFNEAQGWLVSSASRPITPSKPNIPLVVLGSLVLALSAGLSHALYREYRGTQTVRSSEDIERHFGAVSLIGLVPELSPGRHRAHDVVAALTDGRDQEFSEAARSLYASLKLAMLRDVTGGSVVIVTSALPMEGKSSTTGVLASMASAAGQRVVVVDCDLRVPTMHDVLATEPTAGLAGCIEQGINPRDAIRQTQPNGISVLAAGQTRQSPQRLLLSNRFADILATLREEFDLILVDTPPVLGLADTRTIARLADYILITVCWSTTPWKATKLALHTLAKSGASTIGLAMTRVNIERLRKLEVPEAETYRGRNRDYYRAYYHASGETLTAESPEIQGPAA